MILEVHAPLILLAALALDALIGDPDWLWRRLPHPVVLIGRMISTLEARWNRPERPAKLRKVLGVAVVAMLTTAAVAAALSVRALDGFLGFGPVLEVLLAAILLAQRSLHEHVARVAQAFQTGGLEEARVAVSMIVGRDPKSLDEAGVSRAAIETTAENFSDGVVAPAFWYLVAGLPGILAYKAINTADSMIGHLNDRYRDFGWAAARLDDLMNLAPARLSGLFVALAAPAAGGNAGRALRVMRADAVKHKSPNAGWPEAAMAGALGVALAGPRIYSGTVVADPWLNAAGRREADPDDIRRALRVYVGAAGIHGLAVAAVAGIVAVATGGLT